MSLHDENEMLYILHRRKVSRKNILYIMNDLKKSGIFNDPEVINDFSEDWDFAEEQAFWLFESQASNEDKMIALKNIKLKQEEYDITCKSQYVVDQEERIQAKRKELIEKGIIKADITDPPSVKESYQTITRYGRSPLHEAVFMRDIRLVEKYLKSGKFLDKTDNNGHTAMEMAYYDNYKEALFLFERYGKARKARKSKKKYRKVV